MRLSDFSANSSQFQAIINSRVSRSTEIHPHVFYSASMKKGASSLNPYATSYVPLSKRGAVDGKSKYISSPQELQSGNETVWYGHQPDITLTQGLHQAVPQSYAGAGAFQPADFSKLKDHHGGEFYASSSHYQNEMPEKSNFDEDSDMDLAYLLMTYPGISEESLSDVYLANRCDLDAAVDMLNQLELYPDDLSDKLPDTLDIGDVPESRPSSELASQKLKDVSAKAGPSASSSSNSSSLS